MLVDKIAKYQVYLYVVVAIIVLFLLYKFSDNLATILGLKKDKEQKKDEKDFDKQIQQENNGLYDNGVRASYPLSYYNEMANGLSTAFYDLGTDDEFVFETFKKLKNQLDFNLLVKAFGYRENGAFSRPWSLTQWVVDEMSASERKELNKILVSNKIKPAF